jgi:hypothetical protein
MPKENCWKRCEKYFVLFENKTKYFLSLFKTTSYVVLNTRKVASGIV